jgi:hypothetical protein
MISFVPSVDHPSMMMYSIAKPPFCVMTEWIVLSMNSAWLYDGVTIDIFILLVNIPKHTNTDIENRLDNNT